MTRLEEVREALEKAGLFSTTAPVRDRLAVAYRLDDVRKLLRIEVPTVTDLTGILPIRNNGQVHAIRMDHLWTSNHKGQVVAGLILKAVLRRKLPRQKVTTLIDGGNFNSAFALRCYVRLLGMKGMYIMSRLFPQSIISQLEADDFTVEQAPENAAVGREREFYLYLHERMRDPDFRRDKVCLWHARDGGQVTYPIGREIASKLSFRPDVVISCLGAGSTLGGVQLSIQDHFRETGQRVEVMVAEHEMSPLFASSGRYPVLVPPKVKSPAKDLYYHHPELPHPVIGPHFDEVNPFLASQDNLLKSIDGIVQYSEQSWQTVHQMLLATGIEVGNSSAANVAAAVQLANQGMRVLTVIFEPWREFYRRGSGSTTPSWPPMA